MKKSLIVAASALTIIAAPAFAQSTATGEIALNATVAKACGVGNHLSGAAAAPGWDQGDLTVDLTNAGNGQFNGAEWTNRSFGNVWCNGPATVTLEAAALTTSTPVLDTGSFTNRFDLEVTTDAGVYVGQGTDFVLATASEASGVKTVSAGVPAAFETGLQRFGGADSIKVLKNPLNKRPVAGDYTGYLRFTATAN